MQKKINISFILDTNNINWYLFDLIKWCVDSKNYNVCYILKNKNPDLDLKKKNFLEKILFHLKSKGLFGLLDIFFWKYLNKIEGNFIYKNMPRYHKHFQNYKFQNFDIEMIELNPETFPKQKKERYIFKYSQEDIFKIKQLNQDLIINGSEKILKGEILNSTKLGIVSIHHGDNRKYRGGPGGFWEVYNSEPYSGFVIQVLNEKLDAGNIIYRSNFETKKFFLINQMKIAENGNIGYKKVLNYLFENQRLPEYEVEIQYSDKIHKSPRFWNIIKYLFKLLRSMSRK